MKPLRIGEPVTCAVDYSGKQDGGKIIYKQTTVARLDVRPFHIDDAALFESKRFVPNPREVDGAYYFYRDEGLTWVRGWNKAARDALEAAVRLRQSA